MYGCELPRDDLGCKSLLAREIVIERSFRSVHRTYYFADANSGVAKILKERSRGVQELVTSVLTSQKARFSILFSSIVGLVGWFKNYVTMFVESPWLVTD